MDEEEIVYRFIGDISSLTDAAGNASKILGEYANKVTSSFNKIGNATKSLKNKVTKALSGFSLGAILGKGTKSAIDYTETLNMFEVAMGSVVDTSSEFINKMASIYGMDPKSLMDTASAFYLLGDAIGFPQKAAQSMALSLTKAGNDIASLYNTEVETAVSNLQSAIQGNSKAVRKYGYDVTQATLSQYAMKYGLDASVGSLSEVNKRALRYLALMEQMYKATDQVARDSSNAGARFGDFANTIEQPANQLRIFKEQLTMLGRAIGDFFVTPLARAIAYVNGFIMALRSIINFIGSFIGILSVFSYKSGRDAAETAEDTAEAVGGIGGAAGGAAKELKKLIAPFDELTVLNSEMGGGGGGGGAGEIQGLDPALLAAIEEMELKLENIQMKAIKIRDTILEWLGFKISGDSILAWDGKVLVDNLGKATGLVETFSAIYDHWGEITQGIKEVWNGIGDVFDSLKSKVAELVASLDPSLADFFSNLGTSLSNLGNWLSEHSDTIADFIIKLGEFLALIKLLSFIQPVLDMAFAIGALVASISLALSFDIVPWLNMILAGTSLGTVAATIGLVAAAIVALGVALAELWATDTDFRASVSEGWTTLVDTLKNLWNNILKPVLDVVWALIQNLWSNVILPVVSGITQILMELWTGILAPILNFIIDYIGPTVKTVASTVIDAVNHIFTAVKGIIDGIMQFLRGLVQFISGIVTGDISKILEGLRNIVEGILKAIGNVVSGVVNTIIGVVNSAIANVWGTLVGFVNEVLSVVNKIGGLFGASWSFSISATPPKIPYMPAAFMATGGYVQGPTTALIGEAGREAVLPLDQNTGWADIVADKITSAMGMAEDQPVVVNVYLDGRRITQEVTKRQRQVAMAKGV